MASGLETEAYSSPCSLEELKQICFFPLWLSFPFGATRDWTGYCQAPFSRWILQCSADPLPFLASESLVTARVWLSREAAPNLLHRRFWSEAFSCRLEPRLRLGGLLLFVEPGRFQDVIAQGEPSFLPGINKAAYGSARSAQRGWSHSQWASQAQPQRPSPAQPAAPKH